MTASAVRMQMSSTARSTARLAMRMRSDGRSGVPHARRYSSMARQRIFFSFSVIILFSAGHPPGRARHARSLSLPDDAAFLCGIISSLFLPQKTPWRRQGPRRRRQRQRRRGRQRRRWPGTSWRRPSRSSCTSPSLLLRALMHTPVDLGPHAPLGVRDRRRGVVALAAAAVALHRVNRDRRPRLGSTR